MDRKMGTWTSWVLVGATVLLGGCTTPGFHNQEPPGFSTTFQQYDRHWQPVGGCEASRAVQPAVFEREATASPAPAVRSDTVSDALPQL